MVDVWFVVSWDRVPNHFDSESRSPPIEGWFGGSRQQLLHIAPIARARENVFVRKLFQANQVSISIKLSTPDRSRMVPMLANTKLKPNGPLICGLQRLSAQCSLHEANQPSIAGDLDSLPKSFGTRPHGTTGHSSTTLESEP